MISTISKVCLTASCCSGWGATTTSFLDMTALSINCGGFPACPPRPLLLLALQRPLGVEHLRRHRHIVLDLGEESLIGQVAVVIATDAERRLDALDQVVVLVL